MNTLDNLIQALSRLPGIGPKSAARIGYHLIKTNPQYNKELAKSIGTIQDVVFPCPVCGSYTEISPCRFCSDSSRDRELLCVVEQPQDVVTISTSGSYNGLYHVLGGAISPLDGIGPEDLSFDSLMRRISEGSFQEVIIATNPTEEGDTTAMYIRHLMKDFPDIILTRLASGLPIGGDLEYADRLTLARSLRGRIKF
ncbi:recombination mediator RecR [Parasphaerochaeta coccoides]|uniref:Recombination protein RecR n=1 Tax=Parasphaerochaeta coccoides (strain ATCC BAA-1237 / DSM 17374 / SPN1) TaxID=760011 RepID=F4GLZ8_PARC1|nr:recombination mediator RecR [Parasphaerochaeta coccoides]AEC03039.1 DNA replication and repair protein RecR [Parasphaerochaeta coccoides DSM 17374]